MTTIAYKGGILAADTQGDWGGTRTTTTKLHRLPGLIVAGSGHSWRINAAVREIERLAEHRTASVGARWREVATHFYDPHFDRDKDSAPTLLLIQPGTGNYMRLNGPIFMPCDLGREFIAIGSGCEYALGAMAAGANAADAVRIAISLDVRSGGEVETVNVKELQP